MPNTMMSCLYTNTKRLQNAGCLLSLVHTGTKRRRFRYRRKFKVIVSSKTVVPGAVSSWRWHWPWL